MHAQAGKGESAAGPSPSLGQPDRLFHRFLEAVPDAVVIIDGNGAIVRINSQTENLFGYRREELLGVPLEALMPGRFRGSHMAKTRAHALVHPWTTQAGSYR